MLLDCVKISAGIWNSVPGGISGINLGPMVVAVLIGSDINSRAASIFNLGLIGLVSWLISSSLPHGYTPLP